MEGSVRKRPVGIKICGITREAEILWLNGAGVEYAGFVLWEKSRRFVTAERAQELFKKLNSDIKKVAVTVSPDRKLAERIVEAGFDLLQIHGTYDAAVTEGLPIPVWRAVNLREHGGIEAWNACRCGGAEAVLLDAADYGSGRTFGWDRDEGAQEWRKAFLPLRASLREQGIRLVLAGGLHAGNVAEGIRLFEPDIVDVSSGVEADEEKGADARSKSARCGPAAGYSAGPADRAAYAGDEGAARGFRGKSREKVRAFVAAVRMAEEGI